MKNTDEDIAYGKWQQRKIERDWGNVPSRLTPQTHQSVGTVIPFSRTVDRDPNPRIPLSVPEHLPYMGLSGKEALVWLVLVGLWLAYLLLGTVGL